MKKHLPNSKSLWSTTLILFFAFTSAIAQTPITNGGFEDWEDVPVAFVPDDWEVEKDHETGDLINARVEESTEGNYSLKLTTIVDPENSDPLMGFAVLGEVGDAGPEGGIPWTEAVDELQFDVKYSTEGADAAMAMVQIFDASGENIGGGTATYTGVQDPSNEWVTETIALSYIGTPAEILIGFISSNYMDEPSIAAGSWIQVDNVRLFNSGTEATTTIPNFSFENWSDFTIYDPVGWSSTNMELSENGVANVTQSTNAFEGTYAARLENLDMGDYIMTGGMNYGDLPWSGTTSYDDKPEFLIGSYNYTPIGADQGRIHLSLKDASDNILGNALFDFGATSDYETFVLPINYWSTDATDNVQIGISAGEIPVAGSVLLVDDFQFVNGYNVNFTVQDNASPEPNKLLNATIEINTYKGAVLATDLNGSKIVRLPNGTYDITVSLSGYDDYTGQITVNNQDINETITMPVATGIEEQSGESLSVIPNPASDKLSIKAWQQVKRIRIHNMSGVVVLDQQTNGQKSEINISGIPTGQYVIQLETNKTTISKSIMIAR